VIFVGLTSGFDTNLSRELGRVEVVFFKTFFGGGRFHFLAHRKHISLFDCLRSLSFSFYLNLLSLSVSLFQSLSFSLSLSVSLFQSLSLCLSLA